MIFYHYIGKKKLSSTEDNLQLNSKSVEENQVKDEKPKIK